MKNLILILCLILVTVEGFSQGSTFTESELREFQRAAENQAEAFGYCIEIIANKSASDNKKQVAIKTAIDLFTCDTVRVQVSYCPASGKSVIISKSLKDYLRRLSMLDYDEIFIVGYEYSMIGGLKKGLDGKYHGTISFSQRFRGTKGEYIYEDRTEKHIDIVLETSKKLTEMGVYEDVYEILLSDINIKEPCL